MPILSVRQKTRSEVKALGETAAQHQEELPAGLHQLKAASEAGVNNIKPGCPGVGRSASRSPGGGDDMGDKMGAQDAPCLQVTAEARL